MEYETYDPEKHGATRTTKSSSWRNLLEAAAVTPAGVVMTHQRTNRPSLGSMAKRFGYKYRTETLADGSGFVLWVEKLPDPLSEKLP